jgi:hypothetical protein
MIILGLQREKREERRENLSIQEIEQISITILMDNTTDLLLTNAEHAIRPPFVRNEKVALPPPVAEHGFSALINTSRSGLRTSNSFLFDTGVSENGVIHNANIYGIDLSKIDGIILTLLEDADASSTFSIFVIKRKLQSKKMQIICII